MSMNPRNTFPSNNKQLPYDCQLSHNRIEGAQLGPTEIPNPTKTQGRYMPGLDGLRALAVLAVIVYHLNQSWAPGGLLGVGVFFVLSGYLITDILLAQWDRNGRLDMKDFWLRRARRLLPALISMLVLVIGWLLITDIPRLMQLKGDIVASLLYINNWWLIFHEVSYFESFGPPSPLGHLWSLAVEEQFYLLWPLLVALGLRYVPRRFLAVLALVAAVGSALAMAMIYQPGTDPSRVYYGTDTRVFGLLAGAVLAMIWPSRKLSPNVTRKARLTLDAVGMIGMATIGVMIWATNQYDDSLYQGGLVVLSIATAVVVGVLAHPASRLGKVMGAPPLRWIGVRSYGIYLWHYPVIVLTTPAMHANGTELWRICLQVVVSIGLAAFSWKFIEEPIRHGAIGRIWTNLNGRQGWKGFVRSWRVGVSAAMVLIAVGGCAFLIERGSGAIASTIWPIHSEHNEQMHDPHPAKQGDHEESEPGSSDSPQVAVTTKPGDKQTPVTSKPNETTKTDDKTNDKTNTVDASKSTDPQKQDREKPTSSTTKPDGKAEPNNTAKPDHETKPATPSGETDSSGKTPTTQGTTPPKKDPGKRPELTPIGSGEGITAVGDSVMLDIEPYLNKLLPGIEVDGKIGRQMSQASEVVSELKTRGKLGKYVIIQLGTNGPFNKTQLEKLLQSLGQVEQIILVNTRVPRPWESVVNTT